jgi:hypothetical protein
VLALLTNAYGLIDTNRKGLLVTEPTVLVRINQFAREKSKPQEKSKIPGERVQRSHSETSNDSSFPRRRDNRSEESFFFRRWMINLFSDF